MYFYKRKNSSSLIARAISMLAKMLANFKLNNNQ